MGRSVYRVAGASGAALVACAAVAQTPPDYGLNWVTVGAPGNRPANQSEAPGLDGFAVGAVGYEYRLTRTEVTAGQWLEFVQAYGPHWVAQGGHPRDLEFTGTSIDLTPSGYEIVSGAENCPTNMGWRFAARYCNWLHNGKVSEAWAFESGAYDASTFGFGPDGVASDQAEHSPGARFWIPTGDEWTKAAYYDPNRYGPGQDGYWLYPHASNEVPASGMPEQGGETNAGDGVYPLTAMNVGSYPTVSSPWGLLDVSGGQAEWTETVLSNANRRLSLGSEISLSYYDFVDRIDWYWLGALPPTSLVGLRVAGIVPGPATVLSGVGLLCLAGMPRRR